MTVKGILEYESSHGLDASEERESYGAAEQRPDSFFEL